MEDDIENNPLYRAAIRNDLYIQTLDMLKARLVLIDDFTQGPQARAGFVQRDQKWGYLLINRNKADYNIFVDDPIVELMIDAPLIMKTMKRNSVLTSAEIKTTQNEIESDNTSEMVQRIQSSALWVMKQLHVNARMNHVANKIKWLSRNWYPQNRPRQYWPVWFFKLNNVTNRDIICFKCGGTPNEINNFLKPVWSVFHISELDIENGIHSQSVQPTTSDQVFLCPSCTGMADMNRNEEISELTIMYVVEPQQEFAQPQNADTVPGKYVNANWFAHTPLSTYDASSSTVVLPGETLVIIESHQRNSLHSHTMLPRNI